MEVARRCTAFIVLMRGQLSKSDNVNMSSTQIELFDFLKKITKAKSRPVDFVYGITQDIFDLIDNKHFTTENVEMCFQ